MSAIRNVGELASPYFLLEVWARREEIDIDPETYATLKRKARALVRDARASETRGEEPDEDWQARRRDLLAVDGLVEQSVVLDDGSHFPLGIWRNGNGEDALLIGDLPGFTDPDHRSDDASDPPSTAFELALDAYNGEADWGVLLAGLEIRVYRRSSGISQQYLALDLDSLVELDDEANWRAFAGIFRASAFALGPDDVPLIRRVVDESRRHAAALADDMRADVVAAAEAIIQGALNHPENRERLHDPSRALLHQLFEETLYYLYRILFVLYAEAREVLPLGGAGPYAATYSIDHLIERARKETEQADGSYYGATIGRLFTLLWEGPADLAERLGFEPVGGELFDPARTQLLDSCTIADPAWRRALTAVALGAPGSARRRLGRRSSFAEIGVDRLGSIYEGLLVLEPYVAPGPRVLARVKGERRVLEPGQEADFKILRELQAGDFVLESASGRRKGSGSFYTPAEITEYLAHAALDPFTERILATAGEDPAVAAQAILSLRVCDPAMGSGAFLVQAARVLALALARARAARGDGRVTPEMVQQAKRDVVRRCLYGVDLNPLATALAKISLWLETLERGKPLSFLDAHLRCGDSLVGVDLIGPLGALNVNELATWPKRAAEGLKTYLKKEAGERGEAVVKRLKERKAPTKAAQESLPGIGAAAIGAALEQIAADRDALLHVDEPESIQLELDAAKAFSELETAEDSVRNRLREAANFWCAQWFSEGEDAPADENGPVVPVAGGAFEEILAAILTGAPLPDRLAPQLEAARRVAQERRFFHWALEFPEVMIERGGFDAVIGNPPWNTLSPDVKEFFGTYDPHTFRKGVPKATQSERREMLRQDIEIDGAWRREARYLHELSSYAKPDSGRFTWFAPDPQLRKGDANVFRLFVERAYELLRPTGRLAQVLPDSVYVSSPATGVRQHLLSQGQVERCYVFENRRVIFPIHRSVKVVLLTARRGDGPTERFRAAFFVGRDAAGRERAVSLEDLPAVLAELDREAPELAVSDVRALTPNTWSFPELQTALDAQIAAHCAATVPALNLDERGWGLKYCRELDADKDAWRFKDADYLASERGAKRDGLRWLDPEGFEWWPLIEGQLFYHLEFPVEGKEPEKWVKGPDVASLQARRNDDGTSVMAHYRVAWRDVASATNERSAIACVLPPRTAAKDTSLTVWGGSLDGERVLALAAVISSFCFDYLIRFGGKTHLKYGAVNPTPVPSFSTIQPSVPLIAEAVCRTAEFDGLWMQVHSDAPRLALDVWEIAQRRASIDAAVAGAYGLSLQQYAAVLSTFPNLDTIQPMLPGEPKSFVTRDLALLSYCGLQGLAAPEISELLAAAGVNLPKPRPEHNQLDARVARYRALGAVPYRPTPRGGRAPTDPELIESITSLLSSDGQTPAELAEALDEEAKTVKTILERLVKDGEAFAQGSGKGRRFYVIDEEE